MRCLGALVSDRRTTLARRLFELESFISGAQRAGEKAGEHNSAASEEQKHKDNSWLLSSSFREQNPRSSSSLNMDDAGAYGPFKRGSSSHRSLPKRALLSKADATNAGRRPVLSPNSFAVSGLLFLTHNGETRKTVLPASIDSMAVIRTLFVQAFPKLTMQGILTDKYEVYIHDQAADRFFILTHLTDIKDGTMLKLVTSRPMAASLAPGGPVSNGCSAVERHNKSDLAPKDSTNASFRLAAKEGSEIYTNNDSSSSSTSSEDSYTRDRVAALEAQLRHLTSWVQSALLNGRIGHISYGSTAASPAPVVQPEHVAPWPIPVLHNQCTLRDGKAYRTTLKHLMVQARDLRMEVRSLRLIHQAQSESMKETIAEVTKQILVAVDCVVHQSCAWQAMTECMQADSGLSHHRHKMSHLENQLSNIEKCVEELRSDVVTRRATISASEIEAYASHLSNAGHLAASIKTAFQKLYADVRSSATRELERAIEQERYMDQGPEELDQSLYRIKRLTLSLSSLEQLASTKGHYLEHGVTRQNHSSQTTDGDPASLPTKLQDAASYTKDATRELHSHSTNPEDVYAKNGGADVSAQSQEVKSKSTLQANQLSHRMDSDNIGTTSLRNGSVLSCHRRPRGNKCVLADSKSRSNSGHTWFPASAEGLSETPQSGSREEDFVDALGDDTILRSPSEHTPVLLNRLHSEMLLPPSVAKSDDIGTGSSTRDKTLVMSSSQQSAIECCGHETPGRGHLIAPTGNAGNLLPLPCGATDQLTCDDVVAGRCEANPPNLPHQHLLPLTDASRQMHLSSNIHLSGGHDRCVKPPIPPKPVLAARLPGSAVRGSSASLNLSARKRPLSTAL